MSETSNGMPDLSAGDSEPSMEDILASIRKIIADDKSEAPTPEIESEDLVIAQDESTVETSSFSETVEEQQIEIPEIEGTTQPVEDVAPVTDDATEIVSALAENDPVEDVPEFEDEEILDLINFADEEIAAPIVEEPSDTVEVVESSFDESLDLVMDSDASDYYSESTESDENRLLREEIENELNSDSDSLEVPVVSDLDLDLVTPAEELPAAPDLDELLNSEVQEQTDILSMDDESAEEMFSYLADADGEEEPAAPELEKAESMPELDETESILSDVMELDSEPDIVETPPVPLSEDMSESTEDEDMDLVKSLLADLMDEPEEGELEDDFLNIVEDNTSSEADNATPDVDDILDEILYQSMEDETVVADAENDELDRDESELAAIARNAREAAVSPYPNRDEIRAEDTVELPERNLGEQLNLAAAGGFVGVAAGAALSQSSGDDEPTDLDAQVSQMVEEELDVAEIEELLDMIEETETETSEQDLTDADQSTLVELVEEIETPQEKEDMGRAAKKEALLDEDIEQESSEAFAALSHVVQEKAELEENGPAIGDLVQDALRPMLKEWLDKNLKGIVERAVTKEVKRISSGK